MTEQKQTTSILLRVIYTVFLALLISLFFGLGVAAFYPRPKAPEYTPVMKEIDSKTVEAQNEQDLKYQQEQSDYQTVRKQYDRNVSMITLGLAVLAQIVSLLFLNKILIISDGLMLGGVFTLVYSIILGFSTEDARYRFVIVSVGLLITLGLGYIKFIKPNQEKDA
jgi:predicted histidine transporter YuiF (NhaC family)